MRGVGHEPALLVEGRVEAREQLVEGGGELTQLVARVCDRQLTVEAPGPDLARSFRHRGHGREPLTSQEPPAEARQNQHRRRRQIENLPQRLQFVLDCFERLAGEDDVRGVRRRYPHSPHGEAVMIIRVTLLSDCVEVDLVVRYRTQVGQSYVQVFFVGVLGEQPPRVVEDHHCLLGMRQLGRRALRRALTRLPLLRVVRQRGDRDFEGGAQGLVHAPVERAREHDVDGDAERDKDERERAHVPQREAAPDRVNHRRRPPSPSACSLRRAACV